MGPLEGIRVIEFGGIGAVPFCAQMLADMGAKVIRIERKDGPKARLGEAKFNVWFRGRKAIFLDFKNAEAKQIIFKLIDQADATIEGFRPGVMERLGLGPDECLKRNPKLIYGRLTGYGRDGGLSMVAGHDINYLALSGGLHAIGHRQGRPTAPLNLIGDLGGGGLMLAFGLICAIVERQKSGVGQVVDTSMVDGCAALMGAFYGWWAGGVWEEDRGTNLLDSGAPFYDTYETSDGKYVALGSIEPEFYGIMLRRIGIHDLDPKEQMDKERWPEIGNRLATTFKSKTREEWCELLEGTDACLTPVLTFSESIKHPHIIDSNTFIDIDGVVQPSPTPRFSRTQPTIACPPEEPTTEIMEALIDWGLHSENVGPPQGQKIDVD